MLTGHEENEILALTNPSLVGEAIIVTLALLPTKITLKDIIISPNEHESDKILIVNFH